MDFSHKYRSGYTLADYCHVNSKDSFKDDVQRALEYKFGEENNKLSRVAYKKRKVKEHFDQSYV